MNKKLEKDIQREICEWLASEKMFFWRANNIPIFGRSNDGEKRFRAMPKYTPKGIPDILCLTQGNFIGLEVKRPEVAKLSPDQERFKEQFNANGGYYYMVTSVEEAQNKIKLFTDYTLSNGKKD